MKILILEDDPIEAERLSLRVTEYFKRNCHIVGPLENFADAIEAVKQWAPNIALVDIALGQNQFGGINFAETLQGFYQIPVIFLTGINDPKILNETAKINFSDLICKPWNDEGLFRALEKVEKSMGSINTAGHRTFIMPNKSDRFWLKINKGEYEGINYENIVLVRSAGHYNEIVVYNQKSLFIIAKLKDELYNLHFGFYDNFFLLGRSCILNRKYVHRIRGNEIFLRVDEKKIVPQKIPRNWKEILMKWLGIDSHAPHA